MANRVTLQDIATHCGFSKSMVAKVLKNPEECSAKLKTKTTILNIAKKLNYRSNMVARGLSLQKSYTIGVLLPSSSNIFYGNMVAEIQHLLSLTDYAPVFAFWETIEGIQKAIDNILSRQVDAIITCEPSYLPDNLDIPVVSYYNHDDRFDFVGYNCYEVIKDCLVYLMKQGHKRITYIGNPEDRRFKAFQTNMKKFGLDYSPEKLIYDVSLSEFLMGSKFFSEIVKSKTHPTAIIAHNDSVAIGLMRKALISGMKIPEELSIIGFDDTLLAKFYTPSLSSIKVSTKKSIAAILLETVFARLNDKNISKKIILLNHKLIIRESTGAAQQLSKDLSMKLCIAGGEDRSLCRSSSNHGSRIYNSNPEK
ncbi:MAG: LacI family DNA-binding transcriptional regulator [Lentisphaeria bacterium]